MNLSNVSYIDIHTHGHRAPHAITSMTPDEWLQSREQSTPGMISLGHHPWYGKGVVKEEFDIIEKAASDKILTAIGESGLDRRKGAHSIELQSEIFIKHIEISEYYELPLIIHNVHCTDDIFRIRKSTRSRMPWIIHGFFGNMHEVEQCVRHNIMISPGIALMIYMGRSSEKLNNLIRQLDPKIMYLETDGVDIEIQEIYEIAAKLMNISPHSLASTICENFDRDFS